MTQPPVVADVALNVMLECPDDAGQGYHLDSVLAYHRHDPFAVAMTFVTTEESLTWTFGRDLLIEGLRAPSGDGDVCVAPAMCHDGRAVVLITLSSPDGHLMLQARADQIAQFVERSLSVVPTGAEATHLDIDALIAQLLA